MSSLAHCFEKFGIHPLEQTKIRKAAKEYRGEGFLAQEANEKSVSDYVKSIEETHKGMIDQVRAELTKRGAFEEITPTQPKPGREVPEVEEPAISAPPKPQIAPEEAKVQAPLPSPTQVREMPTGTPVMVNGREAQINEINPDGTISVGFTDGTMADARPEEIVPIKPLAAPEVSREGLPVSKVGVEKGKRAIEPPDLQTSANQAIPPTAQHLEEFPEEYPEIDKVAMMQDGKVYTDSVHGEIIVNEGLDPEKAIRGYTLKKNGEFVPAEKIEGAGEPLRPAIVDKGEVKTGEVGERHPDVIEAEELKPDEPNRGFVTTEGEMLSRKQAIPWMEKNEPHVYAEWRKLVGPDAKELYSEHYNEARKNARATGLEPKAEEIKGVPEGRRPLEEFLPESSGPSSLSEAGISDVPELNATALQTGTDAGTINAKMFSDLLESSTLKEHGLSGLDVPSQRMVLSGVISSLKNPEIRNIVIQSVPVDVVDTLIGVESPADVSLHDFNMNRSPISIDLPNHISLRSDVADSLVSAIASTATKEILGPTQSIRPNLKSLPAGEAGQVNPPSLGQPVAFEGAENLATPGVGSTPSEFTPAEGTTESSHIPSPTGKGIQIVPQKEELVDAKIGELHRQINATGYERRGDVIAYLVDGNYIRKNIDEEFTNFGVPFDRPYIPKNEIWLDKENVPNEYPYTLDNALTQRLEMARGKSFNEALKRGNAVEKRERVRANPPKKGDEKLSPQLVEDAKKELLGTIGKDKIPVWLVAGDMLREVDPDFVEGGNDGAYRWMPKKTIIIDDDISPEERIAIIIHEGTERDRIINQGMTYDQAHKLSSRDEHEYREDPTRFEASKKFAGVKLEPAEAKAGMSEEDRRLYELALRGGAAYSRTGKMRAIKKEMGQARAEEAIEKAIEGVAQKNLKKLKPEWDDWTKRVGGAQEQWPAEQKTKKVFYDKRLGVSITEKADGTYSIQDGAPWTGSIYSQRITSSGDITKNQYEKMLSDPTQGLINIVGDQEGRKFLGRKGFRVSPQAGNWKRGESRPFAFDPSSTKNQGRFRLLPTENIKKDSHFYRKSRTPGVSYIVGKDKSTGDEVTQAIRFNKAIMPEEKAAQWWKENRGRFQFYGDKPESISAEPKTAEKDDWATLTPNKLGYQARELPEFKKGYFIAQQSPDRFDIVESKVGSTRALVTKTEKGKWQFQPGVPKIGKDFEQFKPTEKIFDTPQKAALEFNRYKDIIDEPEAVRLEEYKEFGRPEVHRNAVINAVNRGESPEGLKDYPGLAKVPERAEVTPIAPTVPPGTAPAEPPTPTQLGSTEPDLQSGAKGKERVASEVASPNLQITAKLRASAELLTKQIQEKRNPAVAQQNVTARRARQTTSAYEEADRLENLQNKLDALADAHELGNVPPSLQGITTKLQIENILRHLKFPRAYLHDSWIKDILGATKGKPGTAKDREILSRVMGREESGGTLHGDKEITAAENLIQVAEKTGEKSPWAKESIAEHRRMLAVGIDTEERFVQARNDLNELGAKPIDRSLEQKIRTAEQNLLGRKIPGYFPTPKATAEQLVEEADIQPGMSVLEPSAGKGNIADVIREKSPDADLETIEWQGELADILRLKGHEVIGSDFLEHQGKYDRIVMNPPFEKFQDIDHVRYAYEHLKPGGRLVSIMSESPFFRTDKKAVEFREWLDSVGGTSEKLPEKSFSQKSERATGVTSRIVIIDKPSETKRKAVSSLYVAAPLAVPFLMNNEEDKRKSVKDRRKEYPQPSYLPPGMGR